MAEPIWEKCSLEQLVDLSERAIEDKIAETAWEHYKKAGGDEWEFFCKWGKTDTIANDAYKHYVKAGENDWPTLSTHGKTEEIKKDASSRIYDISEFLIDEL